MRVLLVVLVAAAASLPTMPWARALTVEEILTFREANRAAMLIAGARQEGQVTLYSSMIVNQMLRPLAEAFNKKYPDVRLTYWRAESAALFTKLSAEVRARNVVADVVEGTGVGEAVVQAGLTQKWASPRFAELPARYLDANNMWAPTRRSFFSIAYNTRAIPEAQAPKTYEDLLDPQYQSKMVWHAGSSSGAALFISNLRLAWGEERALAYLKRLAAQKVVNLAAASARALVDRVIAGETAIALNIFAHHPLISRAKGAQVNSQLMDPVASTVGTMAIPSGAPHPHAAMLLADFILSAEGQQILSAAAYFPVREDTPPQARLAPILEGVAGRHENFVNPETLVRMTPSSQQILQDLFR